MSVHDILSCYMHIQVIKELSQIHEYLEILVLMDLGQLLESGKFYWAYIFVNHVPISFQTGANMYSPQNPKVRFTATPASSPVTGVGMSLLAQSPVPNCPWSLLPQQLTCPSSSRAQECPFPAATETAPACDQVV